MFTGLTDGQINVLYCVAIFLTVAPVVIGAASIAGILGRLAATHAEEPHPGQPA